MSIVNVKKSNQPIKKIIDGYEYVIVFNGQIYNYKELSLELREYNFDYNSDTEVLLYSYIKWGKKCLDKINGDFSFVIYDQLKKQIFFARDRFGIRPFFYYNENDLMLISSEVKGILEHEYIRKEVNFEAIEEFLLGNFTFTSGSCPINQTFFKKIFQLEAGHCGTFSKKGLKIEKYYDFSLKFNYKKNTNNCIKDIKRELDLAIKRRISTEVKYATFLSGGIDSTIVTLVSDNFKENKISYGINYVGNMSNNDTEISERIAKENKIKLINPKISNNEIISYLDDMVKALDSPYGGIHQLGLFSIYKKAREDGVKVVLLGEGADEFNLGYYYSHSGFNKDLEKFNSLEKFKNLLRSRQKKVYFFLKNEDKKRKEKIISRYEKEYYSLNNKKDENVLNNIRKLYIKKFLTYRLEANDRCGMYNSVEGRVPFCDHELTKYSLEIPLEKQINKELEKIILRKSYKNILPDYVLNRKKTSTPKNKDLELHYVVLKQLKNSIKSKEKVWDKILNSSNVEEIILKIEKELKEKQNIGDSFKEFKSNLMFSDKFEYRIKHLFAIYTIVRWYKIYFD